MKHLRKRYIAESNSLHAFAACICHAAACLCNQYHDNLYRYDSTETEQTKAYTGDYNILNR